MVDTTSGSVAARSGGSLFATARTDMAAGLIVAVGMLPLAIGSGVIAFGPLGAEYLTLGIAAALWAIILGATVTALCSTSSFLVSHALPSLSAVQASFFVSLLTQPVFSARPALCLAALSAVLVTAGAAMVLVSLTGIARVIAYAPHPVLAGFKNGIAGTVILLQLKPYFDVSLQQPMPLPFLRGPTVLLACVAVACLIALLARGMSRFPAPLAGLIIATIGYFLLGHYAPHLDLGPTLGSLQLDMTPKLPMLEALDPQASAALISIAPQILLAGSVIGLISTMQTLLAFSVARSLGADNLRPTRDLLAVGLGMMASGAVGGLALCAASNQTSVAHRSGGRTRLVSLTVNSCMLLVGVLGAKLLALLPIVAVVGLVLQSTIQLFDGWSIALAKRLARARAWATARRDWADLIIVALVMLVTIFASPLIGVGLGILLSCLVFIANMSRPLVRRQSSGATLASKRVRSREHADLLRATGERRVVLELNGVLFFGNAEALAETVARLMPSSDMIALDCRGVTDIDATGTAILKGLMEKARKQKRRVLFCNVTTDLKSRFDRIASDGGQPPPFVDLDTALEWMEEQALARASGDDAGSSPAIELASHDFVRGLDAGELELVSAVLQLRAFPAGEALCSQGDDGDRMWLLMKGSVSVRIATDDTRGTRRLASLAQGTTVGEMALIEASKRSATIVANEDIECLELSKAAYCDIVKKHPAIAAKLLGNLLREMAARIRDNHIELRESVS